MYFFSTPLRALIRGTYAALMESGWHSLGTLSLEAVQRLVGTGSGINYVKGLFPESAAMIKIPDKIAVAHIDCDLYEPMKAALEIFYPRSCPRGEYYFYMTTHRINGPELRKRLTSFFVPFLKNQFLVPDKSGTAVVRKVSSMEGFDTL